MSAEISERAFEPYYETTLLSEGTDPNLLYEAQTRLAAYPVYTETDVEGFARIYLDRKATQDQLYACLAAPTERFAALRPGEQQGFRGDLTDYVRLYAFLSQILTFADVDLEKLYVFARYLRRVLPGNRPDLPVEVQQNVDMGSYRIQQTGSGAVVLGRGQGALVPIGNKGPYTVPPEQIDTLSHIIAALNERFGFSDSPEHRATLGQMIEKLDGDVALDAAARANTRENVRLAFDQKVEQVIQEIVNSNFDLYKRITDDRAFGAVVKDFLFDHYLRGHGDSGESE